VALNESIDQHIKIHVENSQLTQTLPQRLSPEPSRVLSGSRNPLSQQTFASDKHQEDFEAWVKNHTFAVAYRDFPYEFTALEQQIIDCILQRAVVLREKPLKDQTDKIMSKIDLRLVANQTRRLKQMTSSAVFSKASLVFPGKPAVPTEGYSGESQVQENRQGGVTFKKVE
jgi:hypothetical protein